ncbi:hypothetical protein [Halorussus amylolyticus]|uniref:hypothetical protein n=1 Tax=Halorussus amylolyticus TaxID=1126242 RepID=UPI00104A08B3|nr:hypothetical protein [Halorussus amylolyticus]
MTAPEETPDETIVARFEDEEMDAVDVTDERGEWTCETDDRNVEVTIRWSEDFFTHASAHVDGEFVALDLDSADDSEFVFVPFDNDDFEFEVTLAWPDDADVDKQ